MHARHFAVQPGCSDFSMTYQKEFHYKFNLSSVMCQFNCTSSIFSQRQCPKSASNPLLSCAVWPLDKSARATRVSWDLSIFQALNPFLGSTLVVSPQKVGRPKIFTLHSSYKLNTFRSSPLNRYSFISR